MKRDRTALYGQANGDIERSALLKDLEDVRFLKDVFEYQRIRGAVFECELCNEKHYLDWDLILDGLEQILAHGLPPAHEPAIAPDPNEYISWDYACGLLDGFGSWSRRP